MRKIGVFGGTFDPPHNGHLALSFAMAKKLGLDKVLIIPTYIPPHKERESNIGPEDRLKMCELAFEDCLFEVSRMEIDRGGRSYTYDTLVQLKKEYPDDELYFIMGSDMFLTLCNWYNAQGILELCTVCTAIRSDDESYEELCNYAKNHNFSEKAIICVLDPVEVSSTQVREDVESRESVKELVPEKVSRYIEERGLYRE